MKNITFSADERQIERARLIARSQRRSLNDAFREWLEQYTSPTAALEGYDSFMKRLQHMRPGRHFSRDEMNGL